MDHGYAFLFPILNIGFVYLVHVTGLQTHVG